MKSGAQLYIYITSGCFAGANVLAMLLTGTMLVTGHKLGLFMYFGLPRFPCTIPNKRKRERERKGGSRDYPINC